MNLWINYQKIFHINNDVKLNNLMQNWGTFLIDSIDLNLLGVHRNDAIKIFDKLPIILSFRPAWIIGFNF